MTQSKLSISIKHPAPPHLTTPTPPSNITYPPPLSVSGVGGINALTCVSTTVKDKSPHELVTARPLGAKRAKVTLRTLLPLQMSYKEIFISAVHLQYFSID